MPARPDLRPPWERRFWCPRIGLVRWARDAPDRGVTIATADGAIEVHGWDRATGRLMQVTRRPAGTHRAKPDPGGEWIWWFDDTAGDELGQWRRQPFGSGPDGPVEYATGLPPAYEAGLELGRTVSVLGRSDPATGYEVRVFDGHCLGEGRVLYRHEQPARVTGLSADETMVVIEHSEHGDVRRPALRILRLDDGSVVADLRDSRGRGVRSAGFAPGAGDPRLLVVHERRGLRALLIWDVLTGAQVPLAWDVPGEVESADWYPDGSALLVTVSHAARSRLWRIESPVRSAAPGTAPAGVTATPVGPVAGTVLAAAVRPDGDAWLLWSSAADPPAVHDLAGRVVLAPSEPAPAGVPIEDVWVDGPGGRVHALLRRPRDAAGQPPPGPIPLLVDVHGGPSAHDKDVFRPGPSAWVDHGFAVVQVNYRGSTGYGTAWREAVSDRIGEEQLEDIAAVADHLVAAGIAVAEKVVLSGHSWGGYLTLLGLGTQPERWALGIASSPIADYVAAYEDELDSLKAFDRSLFGGAPADVPDRYLRASPLTYVGDVKAPVLVLAGRNDPHCPIRQIDTYLAALERAGKPHDRHIYDAGHGSLLDEERVRQIRIKLGFVTRHWGGPALRPRTAPRGGPASAGSNRLTEVARFI
ncbi:S9 family peptidase [Nonomuraea monospora]